MIAEKNIDHEETYKEVLVRCPICDIKKNLNMPYKIINQSKQLTTVSIPKGLVCEHSFQAFLDKNFKVRGYQKVDFEFKRMDYYESTIGELEEEQKAEEDSNQLASLPSFQKILDLLRKVVDNVEILGSGLFTIEGHVLYSSLPEEIISNVMKEFEVRAEKDLFKLDKMFLELDSKDKICSRYMQIDKLNFVLVLFFSKKVKMGMGNLIMKDLSKKLKT